MFYIAKRNYIKTYCILMEADSQIEAEEIFEDVPTSELQEDGEVFYNEKVKLINKFE